MIVAPPIAPTAGVNVNEPVWFVFARVMEFGLNTPATPTTAGTIVTDPSLTPGARETEKDPDGLPAAPDVGPDKE